MAYPRENKVIQLCPREEFRDSEDSSALSSHVTWAINCPRLHQPPYFSACPFAFPHPFPDSIRTSFNVPPKILPLNAFNHDGLTSQSYPNKNDALFSSVHDNVVGSIYFRDGRVRLVHNYGPKYSNHTGLRRFLVEGTNDQSIKDKIQAAFYSGFTTINDPFILEIQSPDTVATGIAHSQLYNSRLYEIFFTPSTKDNMLHRYDHLSRGGMGLPPCSLTGLDSQASYNRTLLIYIVRCAQVVTETANDYVKKNIILLSNEMECAEKNRAEQELMSIIILTLKQILHSDSNIISRDREILKENVFHFLTNTQKQLFYYARQAAQEAQSEEIMIKCFSGYIGNRILIQSGIANRLHINMDPLPPFEVALIDNLN